MNITQSRPGSALQPSVRAAAGRSRTFVGWTRCAALVVTAIAILAAPDAQAADEVIEGMQEVSWFHANPGDVQSFVLFVSDEQGGVESARQIDVGKPRGERTENGQFFSAMVEMDVGEYVAIAAIGRNGLESGLSAWGRPQPSQPGQPLVVEP